MISVRFQGKPLNIMVIQVYAPTSNTEEAEVERFYEDLQDLLELILKKYVLKKYTKELCKKDIHDPDNHNGVITDLEPDILECEVKWALESITTNKASGGDGIPVELFQILKDDAVKVLHSICQQIWKTQ